MGLSGLGDYLILIVYAAEARGAPSAATTRWLCDYPTLVGDPVKTYCWHEALDAGPNPKP